MALGALLGLAGTALGVGAQYSANAQNQANFERQLEFAKYQYEDSKKYNSMRSQVNRMRAAGINPALAIGSGQLGSTATPGSVPAAPDIKSPDYSGLMSSASSLLGVSSQNRLADSQAKGYEIDNLFKGAEHGLKIAELLQKIKKLDFGNRQLAFDTEHMYANWLAQYNNLVYDTSLKAAQAEMSHSQNAINLELASQAKFNTEHQKELFDAQMDQIDAAVEQGYINAYANGTSAAAAMKTANTMYENFINGFEGMNVPKEIRDEIIRQKLELLKKQVEMYTPEKWSKMLSALGGAAGGLALSFLPFGKYLKKGRAIIKGFAR